MIVREAVKRFGRIDGLVNNAGLAPLTPIEETTAESLQHVFEVNTLGTGRLILAAWPVMRKQRSGVIVNVSSMAAVDPFPGFFAYASAKAGVELMARSCATEGEEHGIRAYAVAPGAVETPMLRSIIDEEMVPPERTLSADTVAEVIVGCVLATRAEKSGETIRVPSP
jgi:NAD(P)-dependent dehydrogenase (short-subunit alcohol dehydrogenase family)